MRLRRWPAAARADPTSSPATGSRSAPPTATAAASASTGAATWDGATVSERARGPNGPNGLRAPHCPPAPLTVPPRPVRRRGCRPGGARPPPPPAPPPTGAVPAEAAGGGAAARAASRPRWREPGAEPAAVGPQTSGLLPEGWPGGAAALLPRRCGGELPRGLASGHPSAQSRGGGRRVSCLWRRLLPSHTAAAA